MICPLRTRTFILSVLFVLALVSPSLADREASPNDFIQNVAGGRYLFVMLVTPELQGAGVATAGIDKEIRKRFPCSGLYRKDEAKTPMWTVDWYSFTVSPS